MTGWSTSGDWDTLSIKTTYTSPVTEPPRNRKERRKADAEFLRSEKARQKRGRQRHDESMRRLQLTDSDGHAIPFIRTGAQSIQLQGHLKDGRLNISYST